MRVAFLACWLSLAAATPGAAGETAPTAVPAAVSGFAGTWETTYGEMDLAADGEAMAGSYLMEGQRCTIRGNVEGRRFTFRYQEPSARGEGWFELAADGASFQGQWRQDGVEAWQAWVGQRRPAAGAPTSASFEGVWQTTFGKMRIVRDGDRYRGLYALGGGSTLEGAPEGDRLVFRYEEPTAKGAGWFRLSPDGRTLQGGWTEDGAGRSGSWQATRVEPQAGRRWLVVLEANWEESLADPEYSFGAMLRAFFARTPHVAVRHRFFSDDASLARWIGELAYLVEPTVLVIATHGAPEGVRVGGHTIGAETIARGLRLARSVQLLHFSACLMLKDRLASEILRKLEGDARFPISGYTKSVDWAASAIIEFMYLDLILSRGSAPETAARSLEQLMPFAGSEPLPGVPFAPAGFRLVGPSAPGG